MLIFLPVDEVVGPTFQLSDPTEKILDTPLDFPPTLSFDKLVNDVSGDTYNLHLLSTNLKIYLTDQSGVSECTRDPQTEKVNVCKNLLYFSNNRKERKWCIYS